MSLLLTWFDDKTAAVACDGRAVSWVYGGHVVPIFEDRHKFTVVAPNVVVAVVGSTLVSDHIYPLAADVAMQCDVHHLFECLEIMLPFHAQSFHRRRGPEHFVDYEQNPYHTSIVLVGFDGNMAA